MAAPATLAPCPCHRGTRAVVEVLTGQNGGASHTGAAPPTTAPAWLARPPSGGANHPGAAVGEGGASQCREAGGFQAGGRAAPATLAPWSMRAAPAEARRQKGFDGGRRGAPATLAPRSWGGHQPLPGGRSENFEGGRKLSAPPRQPYCHGGTGTAPVWLAPPC
uniref:Uncharacterized protein n=1 Tax=Oryza sativa subsp. japonica TaxID=39947 RepID=Q75L65_ORYSJ|nr:hypothetical protein [Oryza sativa Japonica Group]